LHPSRKIDVPKVTVDQQPVKAVELEGDIMLVAVFQARVFGFSMFFGVHL